MQYLMKNIFLMMMGLTMTLHADTIDTIGQEKYEQCGYCHEYDGNSLMPMYPKLAGQTSEYISKQLRDFRSGLRKGQMQATAELLSDDDINIVSRYFSDITISANQPSSLTSEQYEEASTLFYKGDDSRAIPACSSCHGNNGQGKALFPRLAKQHENYLFKQLMAFKRGTRRNDSLRQMHLISKKLTEMEAMYLSKFLADLSEQPQAGYKLMYLNDKPLYEVVSAGKRKSIKFN